MTLDRIAAFHDDTLGTAELECEKYERIWAVPEYSNHSPGEKLVDIFLHVSGAGRGDSVIDLGCGTGRATRALQDHGLRATGYDITPKGLQETISFKQGCLWEQIQGQYVYGYCVDVMEHIPIEYTMLTLHQMKRVCKGLFLHICNVPDGFGKAIGEPLHLTVMPFEWWRDHLREIGTVVEARDLMRNSLFYVE